MAILRLGRNCPSIHRDHIFFKIFYPSIYFDTRKQSFRFYWFSKDSMY